MTEKMFVTQNMPEIIDKLIEIYRRSSVTASKAETLDWIEKETPAEFLWEGNVYKYNWD